MKTVVFAAVVLFSTCQSAVASEQNLQLPNCEIQELTLRIFNAQGQFLGLTNKKMLLKADLVGRPIPFEYLRSVRVERSDHGARVRIGYASSAGDGALVVDTKSTECSAEFINSLMRAVLGVKSEIADFNGR